ncbi:MAG: 4'-phosphopantetheinyl transferase superfamily protein [Lachnospiraceae bacterium]|jgi:4'-phosphopantetheinyl transferase|nr:4'-phosphopantetheinyl transferase superfamily protein [Lachnospiraceae bacterium]
MTNIYTQNIRLITDETITKWLTLLPTARREQLEKYHFHDDLVRSLTGEAMVRITTSAKVGQAPWDLIIERAVPRQKAEGLKPFFPDCPDIHFNISHSGDWVVCAISDFEVGIDVEELYERRISPALIKRVLTVSEQAHWQSLPEHEQVRAFYDLWTKKEAYVKCLGSGLTLDIGAIDINEVRYDGSDTSLFDIQNIDFTLGYTLAVCIKRAKC